MYKHSPVLWSVCSFGTLSLSVACSDGGAVPRGGERSPPAASAPTETAESLPRSEIAFLAPPNATCAVHEGSVAPAQAAKVYADDQGIVRLYAARAQPSLGPKRVTIVCNEGAADHVTQTLDLADPATFRSIEPPASPINRTVLPALGPDRALDLDGGALEAGLPAATRRCASPRSVRQVDLLRFAPHQRREAKRHR